MSSLFKKSIFVVLICFLFLPLFAGAQEKNNIEIKLFYSSTCPHCKAEKQFLEELQDKYCDLTLKEYLISKSANWKLLQEFYQQYDVPEEINGYRVYGAVPISFIKDRYFLGYDTDETTGKKIEGYINEIRAEICATTTPNATSSSNSTNTTSTGTSTVISGRDSFNFLGFEISLGKAPPLLLAIVLGTLDGFNACAMVALAFLLTMLLATGARKNLIIIGGTFIFVSGLVYYLFTAAWLNVFLVSKNLKIITSIVGIVVLVFAFFMLKDYFKGIVCKLCEIDPKKESIFAKKQRAYFNKLKGLIKADVSLPIMLLGVALVAAGVNSIELICSFGFPMAFTKILSNLGLSHFSYYFYIFIYILFYMLDDLLVFLLAVFTFRITAVSQKYLKAVKLVSGIVLIVLGLIILFNPELLSFA